MLILSFLTAVGYNARVIISVLSLIILNWYLAFPTILVIILMILILVKG